MKRISYLLLVLLFGLNCLISDAQNENKKTDAFILLKAKYELSGLTGTKKLAARLISMNNDYSIDESKLLEYSETLFDSEKKDEAVFFLETGAAITANSPAMIKRYLATMYYRMGRTEDSSLAMSEYNDLIGQAQRHRYVDRTGVENIFTSPDQVIEKYIEATGGREAWDEIKSLIITIKVNPESGGDFIIKRYYKRPFLFRQEVLGANSFNTTDGKKTWTCKDDEWMESDINYRFGSIDDYMIDYDKLNIKYDLVGLSMINNAPVYHIIRTYDDGYSQDLYFSATNGLLLEIASDYPEGYPFMKSYFSLWDYKAVRNVLIPHINIRNIGHSGPPHGSVIRDIQINPDLKDEVFLPPSEIKH